MTGSRSDPRVLALTRRRFLGLAGGVAVAGLVGCSPGTGSVDGHDAASPGADGDVGAGSGRPRTLVVVQLAGGLDGLSALVPASGRYRDARPTLAVPEADLVALEGTDAFALHPALAPLAPLWGAGRLGAVDGIGMDGQSRSHFAALDALWSAQPGSARVTGWLGRWLDATAPDEAPPLRAVALGAPGPAMVGADAAPTVVLDPPAFVLSAPAGADQQALTDAVEAMTRPRSSEDWAATAQRSWERTLGAVELLATAAGGPDDDTPAEDRSGTGTAAELLDVAAGVLELDAGTQIVQVGLTGFDTHGGQAETLPDLLGDLAAGLVAFDSRLRDGGRSGDVTVVVLSEFGRRVAENGSGTDHGRGGLALLMGDAVAGRQVLGDAQLDALVDGDLPIAVDTRSVYADLLDWLGGPTDEVLGGGVERLGALSG